MPTAASPPATNRPTARAAVAAHQSRPSLAQQRAAKEHGAATVNAAAVNAAAVNAIKYDESGSAFTRKGGGAFGGDGSQQQQYGRHRGRWVSGSVHSR